MTTRPANTQQFQGIPFEATVTLHPMPGGFVAIATWFIAEADLMEDEDD